MRREKWDEHDGNEKFTCTSGKNVCKWANRKIFRVNNDKKMTIEYHCKLCKNEITRNSRKWQKLLFTNMFKNTKRIINWEQMRENFEVIHLL